MKVVYPVQFNYLIKTALCVLVTMVTVSCRQKDAVEFSRDSDQIIAIVNNKSLTDKQLQHELINLFLAHGPESWENLTEDEMVSINLQAIQNLVNTELIAGEAKRRNISVSNKEIRQRIQTLQSRYASSEQFFQELQLRDLTLEDLFEEAERGLMVEKLINQLFESVSDPEEADVEQTFYNNINRFSQPEAIHMSQIVIRIFPDDPEQIRASKKQEMNHLRERIKNGESFGDIAFAYSDCPSSRNHGDLGWISRDEILPELVDAVFSLKSGSISRVLETDTGLHLVKIHDYRPGMIPDYEEVREDVRFRMMEDQKKMLLQSLINQLYETAVIEIPVQT